MNASLPGIDDSLDSLKRKYGVSEANTYRPDLYPTSYVFKEENVTITITPFAQIAKKVDVFFDAAPPESVETLLERYSGVSGWEKRPLSDPTFTKHFPLFSTKDSRNSFLVAGSVMALAQRDVGSGKLVLWIQTNDYPDLLTGYRHAQKKT
jgi:hypothetical protein